MAEMNKRDQGWMRMPPWLLGPLSSSRVQAWRCWWKIGTLSPKHKRPCMKMADIHLHTESLKVRLICYAHPDAQGKEDMKWWKTELPGGVRSVQRTKDMAEKHCCWMGSNKRNSKLLQRIRMLTKALKVFWDRIWFLEVLCQNLRLDVITCMLLQSPIKGKERTSRMLSPEFGTDLVCFFVFHWIEFVNAATFELKKWREDRRHAHPSLVTLFHFSHYK